MSDNREALSPNPWMPVVTLEVGRYYLLAVGGGLPQIGLLESWHGDRPVFALIDQRGDGGVEGVSAIIIAETGDPFRGLEEGGPRPH
jgi:hypothetical protein